MTKVVMIVIGVMGLMADLDEIKAVKRTGVGTGDARELRRNGFVPAIIYGGNKASVGIAIPYKEAVKRLYGGGFMSNVLIINVEGAKHRVLPRDYQLEPVKDILLHLDFWRVASDSVLNVEVPVKFINEESCVGIKQGGVLNVVRHEIELKCMASDIPDAITIDLQTAEIGDSIHISMIDLPEGVEPTITDRDFTIATIAAPTVATVDDEQEAEQPEEDLEDTQEEDS